MPLNTIWINRVYQGNRMLFCQDLRYTQRLVKISVNGDYLGTVDNGLSQLAQGNLALRHDDDGGKSQVGGIGGGCS